MERVLHDTIISLRCHPAVAAAARHAEATYSRHQRSTPMLTNERVLYEAGSADLMQVYMCALFCCNAVAADCILLGKSLPLFAVAQVWMQ